MAWITGLLDPGIASVTGMNDHTKPLRTGLVTSNCPAVVEISKTYAVYCSYTSSTVLRLPEDGGNEWEKQTIDVSPPLVV